MGDEERTRRIRNMQDLLKFCIEGTVTEDVQGESNFVGGMDPERRAWLENAIKGSTVDIVQEMLEQLANIRKGLLRLGETNGNWNRDHDSVVESISNSLDLLLERTEDLDIASDFEKIGGFHVLRPLLESQHTELQAQGAELIAALVQNLPFCQKAALDRGILHVLTTNLDKGAESVKVKSLYGISCLIRGNSEAEDVFVNKLDGFSVLLRAMQSSSEEGPKLRTKSAFLLCSVVKNHKPLLFQMGFIDQIVGLLSQHRDQSHEYLLNCLLNFITDFPQGVEECKRPELNLVALLKQKIEDVHGKPEFQEEDTYCRSVLKLIQEGQMQSVPENANNCIMER